MQTVLLPFGARTFSVPHTFIEDSRTIHVWLNDDDSVGVFAGETLNVSISNRAPVPSINGSLTAVEGAAVTLTASSTDAGSTDGATYSWVVSLGTIPIQQGTGSSLSFTPVNDGTYSVQLTATDDEGATGTVTQNVVVANAIPVVQASSLVFRDTVTGESISTVQEGLGFVLTGSFNDGGLDDTHRVEVDWGDGSPLTIFSLPPGARVFSARILMRMIIRLER